MQGHCRLVCYHCWELFFFSSRRRHTRWPRDWSSDVCSSDLESGEEARHRRRRRRGRGHHDLGRRRSRGRRSEERREGKSVELGGRSIIKKKKRQNREKSRMRVKSDIGRKQTEGNEQ